MNLSGKRSAFTLIELLVVIAIIAILAVVVVLTLNPAQLLAQSRDANRVSDMATLNTALGLYQTDSGGVGSTGTSTIVYTSLIDTSSTCGNLGLSALPAGYVYGCTVSTSTRNTNNSGWIPVNFQNMSAGSPMGSLPIDPTNTSSSGLFYTYSTNNKQFEVTALPESTKQKASLGAKPAIPNYPGVIANGSSLTISPVFGTSGLMGYWPMDEGNGSTTIDQSGGGNGGTWAGTPAGTNGTYYSGGKVGSYAGYFNGGDSISVPGSLHRTGSWTISLWANVSVASWSEIIGKSSGGNAGAEFYIQGDPSQVLYAIVGDGTNGPSMMRSYSALGTWVFIVGWYDATAQTINISVNNSAPSTAAAVLSAGFTNTTPVSIGAGYQGLLDDIRLYNRVLSSAEIAALYNAGK
ncbi:MAG: prepilin-type N-terminal cleavage/methylation domain-containing protein [Candidatus Pacebacteria bacterium]|nr:prepilin-type N-terminal cleavage/methylation domain-containing protein [Candidatus Paceibacterota bacterium]